MIRRDRKLWTASAISRKAAESGGGPVPSSLPSVTWNGSAFEALCCALSYGGEDYNQRASDGSPPRTKYCNFFGNGFVLTPVGTASATTGVDPAPEPVALPVGIGFDGAEDIDIVLVKYQDGVSVDDRYTVLTNRSLTATYISVVKGVPNFSVVDFGGGQESIDSVFVATGAASDYTFVESVITAAGAALWGGDGAGGER